MAGTALTGGTAAADPGERTLVWIIAQAGESGADCASGPFHDNLIRAPSGDTIRMWGCGTMTTKSKTADGGGSFVRTGSSGAVTGSWTALRLLRWQSYDATVEFAGATFEGGQASLLVRPMPPAPRSTPSFTCSA